MEPLILLHPFPMDSTFWDPTLAHLSSRRRIVRLDFPGHGTAPPVAKPSLVDFADQVADRVAMEGGRAIVCGLSMGGYVALALVARHPERVSGLILADARAETDTDEARAKRAEGAALIRNSGAEVYLDALLPNLMAPDVGDAAAAMARHLAERQPGEVIARTLEALGERPDRRGEMSAIAAPTLVVVGEVDAVTPPSASETLAAGIRDARLATIPGAGHLSAIERPREFAALLGQAL